MALDEPKDSEKAIQVNGIDVLISDEVKPAADTNRIDYIKSADGEGFVIMSKSGESCGGSCC